MLEPPSAELSNTLQTLGLCTPRDLRRVRPLVRRLRHDLPPFDSLWLDALVRTRVLTPFQARCLESGDGDRLRVGPYVVIDRLTNRADQASYLVRDPASGSRLVLKQLTLRADSAAPFAQRLAPYLQVAARLGSPALALPAHLHQDSTSPAVLSPFVPGKPLHELLVRRGRFPAAVVATIAAQLLEGLAELAEHQLLHGDIRLAHVRIRPNGQAVLLETGITWARSPLFTIHQHLTPAQCDGLAPERLGAGTSRQPTVRSELYALGCLLWQLLTGRPPYLTADPLAKLAAHQTRRIPDVRDLAPDTPAFLADFLRSCTAVDPAQRPGTFPEAIRLIRAGTSPRAALLKKFVHAFDRTVPHLASLASPEPAAKWPWVAAGIFVLGGIAISLADAGTRSELLALTRPTPAATTAAETSSDLEASTPPVLPMPAPTAEGLIELTETGPYEIAAINQVGPLTVRGTAATPARLLVGGEALRLTAQAVTLEHVELAWDPATPAETRSRAQLLVQCQNLTLRDCRFVLDSDTKPVPSEWAAVAWRLLDRRDAAGGQFVAADCVMTGPGTWLHAVEQPRSLEWSNSLKWGGGPCVNIATSRGAFPLRLKIAQTTLRDTGPLLRCAGSLVSQTGSPRVEVEALDSVFAPEPSSALWELAAPQLRADWQQAFTMTGEGSVVPPGSNFARWSAGSDQAAESLDPAELAFDGLLLTEVRFKGNDPSRPADALIEPVNAPRRSPLPPGWQAPVR